MSDIIAARRTARTETLLLQLDLGERLFIWGFRSMAEYRRRGRPTVTEMQQVYQHFRVDAAFSWFDELIEAFACTAHTPIEIHMPGCPCVSESEAQLMQAAAAAQGGDLETACRGFARWVPVSATEWLLTPVCAIGRIFQTSGMTLPVRHAGAATTADRMMGPGWQPGGSRALH
jgi:hypothetical protein